MDKVSKSYKGLGKEMHKLMADLFPITRSLTGNGVRETLRKISGHIPLSIYEIESGSNVLDWTVPLEWNIKDAYVKDEKGKKVIDFPKNNLHVVSYSEPVRKKMSLKTLKEHIHTLPDIPNAIPYRTTYFEKNWGFCMSHNDFKKLKDGEYEVVIDSTLTVGTLTYAECVIKGKEEKEFIVFTHICHPSLANDGLSGVAVATYLAKYLIRQKDLRYTYRFIFAPTTIGAITWLAKNEERLANIFGGLVLAELGGPGHPIYKKSRRENVRIDRVATRALKENFKKYEIREFSPWGHNERQFCSPGFNLPVGCLMRNPHEEYKQYHNSLDNLEFVKPEHLAESFQAALTMISAFESEQRYLNLEPKAEPQLGKRGIYKAMNTVGKERAQEQKAMLWLLNYSDGEHSLEDISEKSGIDTTSLEKTARLLERKKLLRKI